MEVEATEQETDNLKEKIK